MDLSNYGIKKILPRLIIVAIAINISFELCALAIDTSNLLGRSLYEILYGIYEETVTGTSWEALITALLAGGTAAAAAGGALATAIVIAPGLVTPLLWTTLPLLVGGFLAVLIGFAILALRHAFIIILVMLSPIAILASLLPNTQQWYDRWRKGFVTLLVFYPLFSIAFGGSQLAAGVLISASKDADADIGGILLLIGMVAQLAILPLAPMLLKQSGGILSGVLSKMQGGSARLTGKAAGFAKSRAAPGLAFAKQQAKNRLLMGDPNARDRTFGTRTLGARVRGLAQGYDRRSRLRAARQANFEATYEAAAAEDSHLTPDIQSAQFAERMQRERLYNAQAESDRTYNSQLAGSSSMQMTAGGAVATHGATRAQSRAQAAAAKAWDESVSDYAKLHTLNGASQKDLLDGMEDGNRSNEEREAMSQLWSARATETEIAEQLDASAGMGDADAKKAIQQGITQGMKNSNRGLQYLSASDRNDLNAGTYSGNSTQGILDSIRNGRFSGDSFARAGQSERELTETVVNEALKQGALDPKLVENFTRAYTQGNTNLANGTLRMEPRAAAIWHNLGGSIGGGAPPNSP